MQRSTKKWIEACKKNGGHSTRTKDHDLPMYVYRFNHPSSLKKFRVMSKVNKKAVTHGYFRTLEDALAFVIDNPRLFRE